MIISYYLHRIGNNMSVKVRLYYDSYEKTFGDGTYPQLKSCEACSSEVMVEFKKMWVEVPSEKSLFPFPCSTWETKEELEAYRRSNGVVHARLVWKQMDWASIDGLDGKCGHDLFKLLEDVEPGSSGIVNIYGKSIFASEMFVAREKAISKVRHHTAMPYVLGGTLAKYQGKTKTIDYLTRNHPEVFELLERQEIDQIIEDTIETERT